MSLIFQILALIVMAAVAVVLIAGLRNMMKDGDANTSNKLMQARVMLQFVAVLLLVLTVYFARP